MFDFSEPQLGLEVSARIARSDAFFSSSDNGLGFPEASRTFGGHSSGLRKNSRSFSSTESSILVALWPAIIVFFIFRRKELKGINLFFTFESSLYVSFIGRFIRK